MVDRISNLIAVGQLEDATILLMKEIEKNGFNDIYAILAATINKQYGDFESSLNYILRGLEYNNANYELHLMLGDYYADLDVMQAYLQYETALLFCENQKGCNSEDYVYIQDVSASFKKSKREELKQSFRHAPILIYKSEDICYGLLNHFSDVMAEELKQLGENVEVIDITETPLESLTKLAGKYYKAILGIQTYLFSIKYQDGRNLHDFIFGPKFNMQFDHPTCMYKHFMNGPKELTVLTHDRNYSSFIQKNYQNIKATYIFPPAGEKYEKNVDKIYDLVFVGSYRNPKDWMGEISQLDIKYAGKATALIDWMIKYPNETYENGVMHIFGEGVSVEQYFDLKQTYFYVMFYYRELIIQTILKAGIELHVFGESWETENWKKYDNLVIHPSLTWEESLKVYAQSRLSLNIMSWHKDGMTERIANMMLNRTVVISDRSTYLEEHFVDGQEIMLFNLEEIGMLPELIKNVLEDKALQDNICEKAYEKAERTDTWEMRAKQFLEIVNKYCDTP
ncbi:MAG: glycosyltransferase [Lachnospiraceae bacterium]|nr:glycosyltransferase [Lachnospiraceae bacterium]